MTREKDQLPEQGLTNDDGKYDFLLVNSGSYLVTTRKQGFAPTSRLYLVKAEMLIPRSEKFIICVPLLKEQSWDTQKEILQDNHAISVLSNNSPLNGIQLKVMSSNKGLIDVMELNRFLVLCQFPLHKLKEEGKLPEVYRFMAVINEPFSSQLDFSDSKLNHSWKNSMEESNMHLSVTFMDQNSFDMRTRTINAPSFV